MLTRIASLLRRARSEKGFTLIELVVVIGILGVLAGIAIPRYTDYKTQAQNNANSIMARLVQTAIELYFLAEGEYPDCTPDGAVETGADPDDKGLYDILVDGGYLVEAPVFGAGSAQVYSEADGKFTNTNP